LILTTENGKDDSVVQNKRAFQKV